MRNYNYFFFIVSLSFFYESLWASYPYDFKEHSACLSRYKKKFQINQRLIKQLELVRTKRGYSISETNPFVASISGYNNRITWETTKGVVAWDVQLLIANLINHGHVLVNIIDLSWGGPASYNPHVGYLKKYCQREKMRGRRYQLDYEKHLYSPQYHFVINAYLKPYQKRSQQRRYEHPQGSSVAKFINQYCSSDTQDIEPPRRQKKSKRISKIET